jgi:hypothetical protein
MINIRQLLTLAVIVFLSIQCTSTRPIERSISTPDYNGRQVARNAQFEQKLNGVGIGMTIGATAAGAVAGYQSGIIKYNNDEHQQVDNPVGGAIVGALVGFGTASLTNYLIYGQGKRTRLRTKSDYELWANKYDKNFSYVTGNGNALTVIDRRLEAQFSAKSLEDARHFFGVFPQSPYRDRIFRQAMDVVAWAEIPDLVSLHPSGQYATDAKNLYYKNSGSLTQFKRAENTYPDLANRWEEKAVNLVESYDDARWVLSKYPSTSRKKALFINSLSTTYQSGEGQDMENLIGNATRLSAIDLRSKPVSYARNYMQILEELEDPTTITSLNTLYKDYDWVQFPGRQRTFLRKAWDLSYRKYSNGDKLLEMISGLPNQQDYSHLNLNSRQVSAFLTQQLQREARKNVSLYNLKTKGPNSNGDFDNWRSSFFYDALYVNEVGELKFLYHGTVRNGSKFTLPLEIEFTGEYIATVDAEILNIRMSDIARFFGVAVDNKVKMGESTRSVFIPEMKPGESKPFAVLFDLGKGSVKQGVNIIGLQAYYEGDLANVNYRVDLLDKSVSARQINQQRHWMSMINQSMPTTKVKELFGNEYDPDNYIFELPTSNDYREWYGSDCGCNLVDDKVDSDWLTGRTGDYFLVLENGMEVRYTYSSDGRFEIYDGFMGLGRSKFKTYRELVTSAIRDCLTFYCED